MRRDFTIDRYMKLLEAMMNRSFFFFTVYDYNLQRLSREVEDVVNERVIILRQDVDRLPENSLAFARIQKEIGIRSTFYFRSVNESFEPKIIEEIAGMGHEVGYHYEDLSLTAQRQTTNDKRRTGLSRQGLERLSKEVTKVRSDEDKRQKYKDKSEKEAEGNRLDAKLDNNLELEPWNKKPVFEAGIESFAMNLEKLRKYADVKTICMHGSPMSRWDSRLVWRYYDYRDFGVELEPYFDIDFEEILYLTDTGRRWNGSNFSVRDKGSMNSRAQSAERKADLFNDWIRRPVSGSLMNMTPESTEFQSKYNFKSTNDIIKVAERCELPDRIMMTFHPQRWTDRMMPWVKELVWQNTKNVGKYFLIKIRR